MHLCRTGECITSSAIFACTVCLFSIFNPICSLGGSIRRGARAVHALCGYWGCSVDPFIQSQGGMVTPQSPAGTIYNSSPRRPSPGEVVQIPDAVHARCGYSPRFQPPPPLSIACSVCFAALFLILSLFSSIFLSLNLGHTPLDCLPHYLTALLSQVLWIPPRW